jgi:phosphoglycolate phosphatase-like HAD superfamily hydrolase
MIDAGGAVPWPIRAILFDKDGTLIDYRATWQAANRAAALDLAAAAGLEQAFRRRAPAPAGL